MSCDITDQRRSHVQAVAGAESAKNDDHGCLCDCAVVKAVSGLHKGAAVPGAAASGKPVPRAGESADS